MAIHIGKIIKQKIKQKRVPYKLLTKELNTTRQNIYDYYSRETIDTGILVKLCKIVGYDFFDHYYQEEPLKSIRGAELQKLQRENLSLANQIKHLEETVASQKKVIALLEKNGKSKRMK